MRDSTNSALTDFRGRDSSVERPCRTSEQFSRRQVAPADTEGSAEGNTTIPLDSAVLASSEYKKIVAAKQSQPREPNSASTKTSSKNARSFRSGSRLLESTSSKRRRDIIQEEGTQDGRDVAGAPVFAQLLPL